MSMPRRQWLTAMAGVCAAATGGRFAWGQGPRSEWERTAAELITAETDTAITRGLEFLTRRQSEDGAFAGMGYSRNVAVCSLAGMAFIASGSTPERGPRAKGVAKSLKYVLASADDTGFLSAADGVSQGPMYDHGFATLFIAEAHGMTDDSTLREKLTKAVKLIVATQNTDGGWRYQPRPGEADISVTVCQMMALRAARNAGVFVPSESVTRGIAYIERSQNPDGGFMYMLDGGMSKFPRSAAAVAALYSAGIYSGERIDRGLDYLAQHLPRAEDVHRDSHSVYGQYYAAQVMWQAGGERWHKWYPAIRDALLGLQQPDGSWADPIGSEYGTAVACLILQMPNNYLPIFQR